MKTNYILKSAVIALMFLATTSVGLAKTIYVSAAGNDSNNGATSATALASVVKAVELASFGDEIQITGTVVVDATAEIAKDLNFIGKGDNATIEGNGAVRLFAISEGAIVKFQGITFTKGTAEGSAGAVLIQSDAHVEFYSCQFLSNSMTGDGDGGALTIEGAETYVKIYNSVFRDNTSTRRGGAIGVRGPDGDRPRVEIAYSTFANNSTPEGSGENRGGAFSLFRGDISFYMCDIKNNAAGKRAEPGVSNGDGAGGGAFVSSNDVTIYIENSTLTGNSGTSHGAVVFAMGASNYTFVNTSIINNLGDGDGVGLFWLDGEPISTKFVNVTFAKNIRPGGNDWNFAGVRVLKNTFALDVYNSIFILNAALSGDGVENNGAGDIGFNGDHNAERMKQFVVKNSVIGHIHYNGAAEDAFTLADNPALPASIIGEYNERGVYIFDEELSGLDIASGMQKSATNRGGIAFSALNGINYYTLVNGAYAATLGDPALLEDETGALTDQFNVERAPGAAGSISAGAIQSLVGEEEADAPQTPNPFPLSTGIISPKATQDISITNLVNSGGLLTINFGSLTGKANGELINLNGQVVKKLFTNRSVLVKDFFPMDGVAPGFYILKVTINSQTYTKRLIVK